MARTTKDSGFQPEVLTSLIQGKLAHENVFMGRAAATGAAIVNPTLSRGADFVGDTIKVPYFGTIGEFETSVADGAALTPRELKSMTESATVTRSGLAFETTAWASVAGAADPHAAAADLVVASLAREMDRQAIAAALAGNVMNVAGGAATISWNMVVDAKAKFGDEMGKIAAMAVHSQTKKDMLKLVDGDSRPLMVESMRDGDFDRFCGIPVLVSDQVPLTGTAMGAVTETGTTPPDVTLAGTPLGAYTIRIECVTPGASDGTATFRFSTDDGVNWSGTYTIPSGGGAFVLNESPTGQHAADSLVGMNGATGITATFTNGTYAADNVYRAEADIVTKTLLLQPSSLLLWYNRALLQMETDKDILRDTSIGAMHLYMTAHRYRRRPGSNKTGVVTITHDVSGYDGTL